MAPYVLSEQEGFYRGRETNRARAALTTIGGFSAIRGLVLGFVARPEAVCARRAVGCEVLPFAVTYAALPRLAVLPPLDPKCGHAVRRLSIDRILR
jgi:hypothetical protein